MSPRRRRARREAWVGALLLTGILASLLVIGGHLRPRLDLTASREYSLSPATRALLDRLEDRLQLKLYFNREIEGAEALRPARIVIEDFLDELAAAARGKIQVDTVDPSVDLAASSAADKAGVHAIEVPQADAGGKRVVKVWQGLEMRYQDRTEVIPFVVPEEFEFAFALRLASLLQAQRPVVGMITREPPAPPSFPGVATPMPPGRVFERLREVIGMRYAVRELQPDHLNGKIDSSLAALVLLRPDRLSREDLDRVDRYLEGGGHVLVLEDHEVYDPATLERKDLDTSTVDAWLARFGVKVRSALIWDEACFPIPGAPQQLQLPDGRMIQTPGPTLDYGLVPVLGEGSYAQENVVTRSSTNVALPWVHPIVLGKLPPGLHPETLLRSSKHSWLLEDPGDIHPEPSRLDELARRAHQSGPPLQFDLAIALHGKFLTENAGDQVSGSKPGLLVVMGDSDVFTDAGLNLWPQCGNESLAGDLFDWLCQDEALIALRTRGNARRRIRNFFQESVQAQGGLDGLSPEEKERVGAAARLYKLRMERRIAWANVLGPPFLVLLLALGHLSRRRRLRARPYRPRSPELPPPLEGEGRA